MCTTIYIDWPLTVQVVAAIAAALSAFAAWRAASASRATLGDQIAREELRDLRQLHDELLATLNAVNRMMSVPELERAHHMLYGLGAYLNGFPGGTFPDARHAADSNPNEDEQDEVISWLKGGLFEVQTAIRDTSRPRTGRFQHWREKRKQARELRKSIVAVSEAPVSDEFD